MWNLKFPRLDATSIFLQVGHANADGNTQLSELIPHRGNMQNIDSGMGFPKMFFFDILKIFQPSLSHSTKPIFLRFIVFFTVHLLKVSNGETETELLWGSWVDQPVWRCFTAKSEAQKAPW